MKLRSSFSLGLAGILSLSSCASPNKNIIPKAGEGLSSLVPMWEKRISEDETALKFIEMHCGDIRSSECNTMFRLQYEKLAELYDLVEKLKSTDKGYIPDYSKSVSYRQEAEKFK